MDDNEEEQSADKITGLLWNRLNLDLIPASSQFIYTDGDILHAANAQDRSRTSQPNRLRHRILKNVRDPELDEHLLPTQSSQPDDNVGLYRWRLPSSELLDSIRQMAALLPQSDSSNERFPLTEGLDGTALMAIGIILQEYIRSRVLEEAKR